MERFSLNVIEYLGKSKIHFLSDTSDLFRSLSQAVKALKDKPWITSIVNNVKSYQYRKRGKENVVSILLSLSATRN